MVTQDGGYLGDGILGARRIFDDERAQAVERIEKEMRVELAFQAAQLRFGEGGLCLVTLDLEPALAFEISDPEVNPGPEGEDDEVVENEDDRSARRVAPKVFRSRDRGGGGRTRK